MFMLIMHVPFRWCSNSLLLQRGSPLKFVTNITHMFMPLRKVKLIYIIRVFKEKRRGAHLCITFVAMM